MRLGVRKQYSICPILGKTTGSPLYSPLTGCTLFIRVHSGCDCGYVMANKTQASPGAYPKVVAAVHPHDLQRVKMDLSRQSETRSVSPLSPNAGRFCQGMPSLPLAAL